MENWRLNILHNMMLPIFLTSSDGVYIFKTFMFNYVTFEMYIILTGLDGVHLFLSTQQSIRTKKNPICNKLYLICLEFWFKRL